jgi:diacylglycerol kinase (ATP)
MKFSIRSRLKSFKYAFEGIGSLIRNEHNSRIHLAAAILAIIFGLLLRITRSEWVAIVIVIGLVFVAELINSAIELMADLINPEFNQGIKQIKDYAGAAVLISAIIALITGSLIFIPKLITIIK